MRDEGPSSFILFLFLRLRWGPKNLHLVESNRKLVERKKILTVFQQVTGLPRWSGFTLGDSSESFFPAFSGLKHLAMPTSAAGWMQMLGTAQLPPSSPAGLGTHLRACYPFVSTENVVFGPKVRQVRCDCENRPRTKQEIQLPCLLFIELIWKERVAFSPGN